MQGYECRLRITMKLSRYAHEMEKSVTRWPNARLLSVVVPRVFVTIRLRSAWHRSTSRQYRGVSALNLNAARARIAAEQWRAQGSHFVVHEMPGIALCSEFGIVAVADLNHDDAFANWDVALGMHVLRVGTPLEDVVRAFDTRGTWSVRPDPHSIIQIHARPPKLSSVGLRSRFRTYSSSSAGTAWDLAWTEHSASAASARSAHRLVRAFDEVNGPGASASGVAQYAEAVKLLTTDRPPSSLLGPLSGLGGRP